MRANSVVAVDEQGDAVSLWRLNEPAAGVIEAAFRPAATNVWGPAAAISAPGEAAAHARAAFDEQGDLFVVWQRFDPGGSRVVADERQANDGRWLSPAAISPAGQSAGQANVAVNAQGDAIAAWASGDAIEVAASRADGSWQSPIVLSSAEPAIGAVVDPAVAVGPRGEGLVALEDFVQRPPGQRVYAIYATAGSPSGAWSAPAQLSPPTPNVRTPAWPPGRFTPQGDFRPQAELDRWGNAIVAWQHSVGGDSSAEAATRIGAEGPWQAPVELSAPGEAVISSPHVAADALGNALAVWDSQGAVRAAFRPLASAAWPAPVSLSTGRETPYLAQLAMNERGDAVIAWQEASGGISAIAFNDSSIPAQAIERPTISSARFDRSRFRVGPRLRVRRARFARAPAGAQLDLTLSVWAKLSIVVTSSKPSVRRRGVCRQAVPISHRGAIRRASRGKAKRCTRLPLALHQASLCTPGATSVSFDGRVGDEALALRPGNYTAVLTATNAAGRARPVRLPFTIVR